VKDLAQRFRQVSPARRTNTRFILLALLLSFVCAQIKDFIGVQVSFLPAAISLGVVVAAAGALGRLMLVELVLIVCAAMLITIGVAFGETMKLGEGLFLFYAGVGVLVSRWLGHEMVWKSLSWFLNLLLAFQMLQLAIPAELWAVLFKSSAITMQRGLSGNFSEPSFAASVAFILWLTLALTRGIKNLPLRHSGTAFACLIATGSVTGMIYGFIVVLLTAFAARLDVILAILLSGSLLFLLTPEMSNYRAFRTAEILANSAEDASVNARENFLRKDALQFFDSLGAPTFFYSRAWEGQSWGTFGLEQPENFSLEKPSSLLGYLAVTYGYAFLAFFVLVLVSIYQYSRRLNKRLISVGLTAAIIIFSFQMISIGLFPLGYSAGVLFGCLVSRGR